MSAGTVAFRSVNVREGDPVWLYPNERVMNVTYEAGRFWVVIMEQQHFDGDAS